MNNTILSGLNHIEKERARWESQSLNVSRISICGVPHSYVDTIGIRICVNITYPPFIKYFVNPTPHRTLHYTLHLYHCYYGIIGIIIILSWIITYIHFSSSISLCFPLAQYFSFHFQLFIPFHQDIIQF